MSELPGDLRYTDEHEWLRQEEDGSVTVAFMDPAAVMTLVEKEGVEELASEVKARLERVADGLAA